jgi:hypothetical protein
MAIGFKRVYWRLTGLCRRLQPQQLGLILLIWFVAGFAPITCIIHCQFLYRTHSMPMAHAHMDHAMPETAATPEAVLCAIGQHSPLGMPGLPSTAALPPVVYDALVAIVNLTAPALLLLGLALFVTASPLPHFGKPPTPPPRV